jgi:hypothetical protein
MKNIGNKNNTYAQKFYFKLKRRVQNQAFPKVQDTISSQVWTQVWTQTNNENTQIRYHVKCLI